MSVDVSPACLQDLTPEQLVELKKSMQRTIIKVLVVLFVAADVVLIFM